MNGLASALEDGCAVLLATDTVFGLAALPASPGYRTIFELKEREESQVLPWLVEPDGLLRYGAEVPDYAYALAQAFWPGALTLVVRASRQACELGGIAADGTVALRCPDDEVCLRLLDELDGPLACTSANLHGHAAPSLLADVDERFLQLPHLPLPKRCPGAAASTIVACCAGHQPKILREGAIDAAALSHVLPDGVRLAAD